jgi:PAS domain S-box-containing protein
VPRQYNRFQFMLSGPHVAALRLAAIVESSDDAIISKNLDGIITSWNRAAERIFGYRSDEIVGRSIRLIIPADRQAEEDDVLARIRRGDRVEHFETLRQRKDGTLIAIALTVSPIRDADGTVVGASKIARDITEQRRNAAALEQSRAAEADLQQRLRALVDASGDVLASPRVGDVLSAVLAVAERILRADGFAIWRFDDESGWQVRAHAGLSAAFATGVIASRPHEPLPAMPFAEPLVVEDVSLPLLHEDRRAAYEAEGIRSMTAIPLRISGRATGSLTLYYRTPHHFADTEIETARALGNMAAAALTTAELYEEQRRLRHHAAFLAQASATLATSLDLETTVQTVVGLAVPTFADACAIHLRDEHGDLALAAAMHCDPSKHGPMLTLASRPSPNRSRGWGRAVRDGTVELFAEIDEAAIHQALGDDPALLEAFAALRLTSQLTVPLRAQGRLLGAITFALGPGERRYAQADVELAEDMAGRCAIAILNAQLYEDGRRANQVKDEFLATLSHELRTPLNAILGYARMLRGGVLRGDKQERAFGILERNASALSQIVADILDVSRIVSGKLRLDVVPLDLTTVVGDALTTVAPTAEAKGVALVANLDAQPATVLGDADRLRQIVWNLVSNAVKFTPKGGRVDVTVERAGGHVALLVQDTGIGIAPDFLPHVFERFRQADSRFAREHGGLGLGLAIVRHLLEMHGGSIRASSEGVGRGAAFRAELPLVPTPVDRPDDGDNAALRRAQADAILRDVRVLAVDADEDALSMLRDTLEGAGAIVETAASADEALRIVALRLPHVLVSDLSLPTVDGFELIRRIRAAADAGVRNLPAAALTAYARSEDRRAATSAGYHLHLSKPIDPPALVAAVARLAGRTTSSAVPDRG